MRQKCLPSPVTELGTEKPTAILCFLLGLVDDPSPDGARASDPRFFRADFVRSLRRAASWDFCESGTGATAGGV